MEYIRVIYNVETGEQTKVAFTPEEIAEHEANMEKQAELNAIQADPVEKLKQFLVTNPDVANLLNGAK